jgi:hypothetical protein
MLMVGLPRPPSKQSTSSLDAHARVTDFRFTFGESSCRHTKPSANRERAIPSAAGLCATRLRLVRAEPRVAIFVFSSFLAIRSCRETRMIALVAFDFPTACQMPPSLRQGHQIEAERHGMTRLDLAAWFKPVPRSASRAC